VIVMKEKVLAILQEVKDDVDFATATSLLKNGLLTSLDIISLVSELNDAFDITVPVAEVIPKNFDSVDTICAMVQRILDE